MRETGQWKFEQNPIKLWIFEGAIDETQIENSVTLFVRSPPICPVQKNLQKYIFSLKKIFNHTFTPNKIIANMFLYNPVWTKSIPSTITKKIKDYEIFCTEQIREELARYVSVSPTHVSLMATS